MGRAFAKQPAESFPIAVDFGPGLPAAPTGADWSAIDEGDGSNQTAAVLDLASAAVEGTQAVIRVRGGSDGHRYKLTCRLTCADGSLIEWCVRMTVAEQ